VEVYKGRASAETASFVHYAPAKDGLRGSYMPQNYQFTPGQAYIVFAKKTDRDGVFQQLWEYHKSKEDQGLFRTADKMAHGKKPIDQVVWSELTKMLASKNREDTAYAIGQLDQMSGGGYDHLKDFERSKALEAIEPFIRSHDVETARRALQAIGSRNPYLFQDFAAGWLATIGHGHIPGYAQWDRADNSAAKQFWKPLAQFADNGDNPPELRRLAILALGRTGEGELEGHVLRWIDDREPNVRQAGTALLADFPKAASAERLARLSKDPEPVVRIGVATAVGFGQWSDHLNLLGVLIDDPDPRVETAAALSLLSFSLDSTRAMLEAHVAHPEFGPLIVNALAREKPGEYLDALCKIVRENLCPTNWWGGSIPSGVSWDILFDYAQSRPAEVKQGKLDDVLDALESPDYFSSSAPRDLYALYVQLGLTERAKSFRETCRKRLSYDIDYYFKMVDESPNTYRRNH
jgi:HEAT repeats